MESGTINPESLPSIKTSTGFGDSNHEGDLEVCEARSSLKLLNVRLADLEQKNTKPPQSPLPSDSSQYNSPYNISPSSSAFVSALQSPFLSPRLQLPDGSTPTMSVLSKLLQIPGTSPLESPFLSPSSSGILQYDSKTQKQESPLSLSDDMPSSSYTPPIEEVSVHDIHLANFVGDDFCERDMIQNHSSVDHTAPRVSFSFPAPRVSFAKGSSSPPQTNRLRSCDVYIGIHGQSSSLLRFSKWLCAELELQGIACFAADRARYSDTQSHDIADRIISSATFGVVIISKVTFVNPFAIDEIRIFLQRKNMVPIFFDVGQSECSVSDIVEKKGKLWERYGGELWRLCGGEEDEWKEAIEGLGKAQEWKLDATNGNWRGCILKAVALLGSKLGRKSVAERERVKRERSEEDEFPFPRNVNFVGREKELNEVERILYGKAADDADEDMGVYCFGRYEKDRWSKGGESFSRKGSKKNLRFLEEGRHSNEWLEGKNKEAEVLRYRSRGAGDSKSFKEPHLEAWIEPSLELVGKKGTRSMSLQRSKQGHKMEDSIKTDHRNSSIHGSGIACISGVSGIGKTELALEFAYRFSQRYRNVLWVGGEGRYFRQNFLNLSLLLGLDVSSETHLCPEKGRIKTFEEQENEALQRVRRELLRDVPYLLVIDNLESEMDWWDGRDILELLPRINAAAVHIVITTRLPRVRNFRSLELLHLSRAESMLLMKGKREFSSQEIDVLVTIEDNLGYLTFGLAIVGRLLSELSLTPTALLDAIKKAPLRDITWNARDDPVLKNNPFLVQLLGVVFSIISHSSRARNLASRMVWVGGWFAPSSIPVSILSYAARRVSTKRSSLLLSKKCFKVLCCCYFASQAKKWEADAVSFLIKFSIAKRTCKQGWIHFHEIVQLYARKKGGVSAAKAMVHGIRSKGMLSQHLDHFWAACFLLFGFASDPVFVESKVKDLIVFIKKGVLPLAVRTFSIFSRCHASMELLRLCTNALEEVEKSFVSQIGDWCDKSLCWKRGGQSRYNIDEYVWQDVTLLKALLLETRAKLFLRGGQFDASEELCRTCISIRTVMLGHDHPQTLAAQETLAKVVRYRSKI